MKRNKQWLVVGLVALLMLCFAFGAKADGPWSPVRFLRVTINAWVENSLTVDNDVTIGDDLAVTDDVTVTGDMTVAGTTTLAGATALTGATTFSDNVIVDGSADEVQLIVQGYTTQTANSLVVEQSDGTDVFTVDDSGNTVISGTLTVADRLGGATITVETEGVGDVVTVTIQLEDLAGSDLTASAGCLAYLSDNDDGSSVVATAPDGGIAVGTDGLAIESVADKAMWLVSESDGDIDLIVTESGTKTEYLVIVLPDGTLVVSDAISHAA